MRHLATLTLLGLLAGGGTALAAGDPAAGRTAWERQVPASDGQPRSCVTCHGADPRQPGRHQRTGKAIDAMAPSVQPERFSDPAKVDKWFTRNCKWTWGRLCTPQEQRDIQAYLYSF
jgi:hypothetical protein